MYYQELSTLTEQIERGNSGLKFLTLTLGGEEKWVGGASLDIQGRGMPLLEAGGGWTGLTSPG